MWLMDKRYYILILWALAWVLPTILKVLDITLSSSLRTIAQTYGLQLDQILPVWSWELNRQWVELETFMPLGLVVSCLLMMILLFQCFREAMEAEREWHKV